MSEPLPEDALIAFRLIKSYSGIKGKYLILDSGFSHNRTIDAVKVLVLRNLVYVDLSNYPDFSECRIFPKI